VINLPPDIEAVMPYGSSCGICGGPDARHRVLDAIVGRYSAGDTDEQELADDFGVTVEQVGQILEHWNSDRQRWTAERHELITDVTALATWGWNFCCTCGQYSPGWEGAYTRRSSAVRAWRKHVDAQP